MAKIDKEAQKQEIQRLVNKGLNNTEIAAELEISNDTVRRRRQEISAGATAGVIMSGGISAHVESITSPIAQLKKLNEFCWDVLNEAISQDEKLAATREIRSQLALYVQISKEIYHAESVKRFQDGVLEALQDAHPDLRKEAIQNINRLKEMAGCVLIDDIGEN